MAHFDYVLFDAGGTLLGTNTESEHWFEQFFVDCCAEQGKSVQVCEVHEVLRRAARSRLFHRRASSDAQTRTFWHHIYSTAFADLLGAHGRHTPAVIDHLAHEYIDRFEAGEFIRLFPDTMPALEALKGQGVAMGVVSNFGTYLRDFLRQTGIDGYFEFALISAEEGCEKPQPEIFEKALAKCGGRDAERILFVGDHPEEDYAPSTRHGMSAMLIDRHNKHADKPMNRISRLTELAELVGAAPAATAGA